MNEKEIILEAMKKAGEPLNAGKVAELTGLDRKVVDKAFAERKKDGSIVSPVRCKWEPAAKETARKPTVPIAPRTKEAGGNLSFCFRMPEAFTNFSGGQTASLFSSSFRVRMISSRCRKMKPGLVSS